MLTEISQTQRQIPHVLSHMLEVKKSDFRIVITGGTEDLGEYGQRNIG